MGVAVGDGITEGWAVVVPVAFMLALDGTLELGTDVFSNPSPRTAATTIMITIISAITTATQLPASMCSTPSALCSMLWLKESPTVMRFLQIAFTVIARRDCVFLRLIAEACASTRLQQFGVVLLPGAA